MFSLFGTTCSSALACFRVVSAIVTRCCGCCCIRRIFCCSTSPPTTSTCARKTYCWSLRITGTVVFVSHDRYFIDKLATRVFEVGDGKVEIFPAITKIISGENREGSTSAPTLDDVPSSFQKRDMAARLRPTLREVRRMRRTQGTGNNGNAATDASKKRLNPIKRKQIEDRVKELEEDIGRAEIGHRPMRNRHAKFRECRRKPAPVAGTRPAQGEPCRVDQGMGRGSRGAPRNRVAEIKASSPRTTSSVISHLYLRAVRYSEWPVGQQLPKAQISNARMTRCQALCRFAMQGVKRYAETQGRSNASVVGELFQPKGRIAGFQL